MKNARNSAKQKDDEATRLAYKVFSAERTDKALKTEDVDQLERLVVDFLELKDLEHSLKECATLDFYVAGIWWCRTENYSVEQTSAFVTVMDVLFKNIKQQMSIVDNIKELKQVFPRIYQESDVATGQPSLFSAEQTKNILGYFHTSLFQHYKLYECALLDVPLEFITGVDLEVEVAKPAEMPWPPPMNDAIRHDVINLFIEKPEEVAVASARDVELEEKKENEERSEEEKEEDTRIEMDLLSQMEPEEIKNIIKSVYSEMLAGLEEEIATKIRQKEIEFISKINQFRSSQSKTKRQSRKTEE